MLSVWNKLWKAKSIKKWVVGGGVLLYGWKHHPIQNAGRHAGVSKQAPRRGMDAVHVIGQEMIRQVVPVMEAYRVRRQVVRQGHGQVGLVGKNPPISNRFLVGRPQQVLAHVLYALHETGHNVARLFDAKLALFENKGANVNGTVGLLGMRQDLGPALGKQFVRQARGRVQGILHKGLELVHGTVPNEGRNGESNEPS